MIDLSAWRSFHQLWQTSDALKYLHSGMFAQMIHGDIKAVSFVAIFLNIDVTWSFLPLPQENILVSGKDMWSPKPFPGFSKYNL